MKLDANERAAMLDLLHEVVGSHDTLHTLRRVRGLIGFTADDLARIRENPATALEMEKEVQFDDWTIDFVQTALKNLDQAERLPDQLFTLYEKFVPFEPTLPELPYRTSLILPELRKGKKTVALVGMAPSTCNFAPWADESVEIWGCNEAHAWAWFKRANRWFQIHDSYKQKIAKRGVRGHYDWLKANVWGIPIYMQQAFKDIPNSVPYPLNDVWDKYLSHIRRGEDKIKYFNSSFDYMIAVALLEGFERIEVYGFDMMGDNEYEKQLPSASFWLGVASQHAELYLPAECMMLKSDLYGGRDQGEGWT